MDPITHAASGAVAMLAMPHRPASRWAVPLAALAAASPDMDVAFAHTPLQFLLLHRGITHSLAAAPLLGLVFALAGYALREQATAEVVQQFTRIHDIAAGFVDEPLSVELESASVFRP